MQLPEDIVELIREYSKPLTRSDWKRLHKLPHSEFGILLFIGSRFRDIRKNRLCRMTFEKACVVLQDRQEQKPRIVQVPQFCTFRGNLGNGCTTKSKTKRQCPHCSTPVCLLCKNCPLHR
jgi:hypothetical protein